MNVCSFLCSGYYCLLRSWLPSLGQEEMLGLFLYLEVALTPSTLRGPLNFQVFPFRGRDAMQMKSLQGQPMHKENKHCSREVGRGWSPWQLVFKYFQMKGSSPPRNCLCAGSSKNGSEALVAVQGLADMLVRSAANLSPFCKVAHSLNGKSPPFPGEDC